MRPRDAGAGQSNNLISGRALIFWDPMSLPGTRFAKKLDAIDTDQITPAADCVSESLETLDEKWKAGSFRHLMPDFRAARACGPELRHCRRPLRDRLLARNEPGRAEGCRRRSRPRTGHRLRQQHGRHLSPQQLQSRPSRRAESGGRGRRPRRRRVHLRPGHPRADERHAGEGVRAGAAVAEGRRDPQERRHLRRRTAGVPRVGADAAVD